MHCDLRLEDLFVAAGAFEGGMHFHVADLTVYLNSMMTYTILTFEKGNGNFKLWSL